MNGEEYFPMNYIPEILCLIGQFFLTVVSIMRVNDNREIFPVKQLGPNSTILCVLCFFFASGINFVGRIIYDYYGSNSQCTCQFEIVANHSKLMVVFSILYNIVRQLPFLLFSLKILRVSICFWPTFNKIDVERINRCFVSFMKHDSFFCFACIVYVCVINVIVPYFCNLDALYQFFCHKQFTNLQLIEGVVRFFLLGSVYFLSIYTYDDLDFTRLLLLLFITFNFSIIPQIVMITYNYCLEQCLRYPVYFTAFILELINNCTILYYSGSKNRLTRPAQKGVLEVWRAFNNVQLGMNILRQYAAHKDGNQKSSLNRSMASYLQQFQFIDSVHQGLANNKQFKLSIQQITQIQRIWNGRNEFRQKIGEIDFNEYRGNINNNKFKDKITQMMRRMVNILSHYCQYVIFVGWKKTQSYKHLKQDFINNGDINQKLDLFQISLS